MARKREDNHPLAEQGRKLAEEAAREKAAGSKPAEERAQQGGREKDVRAARVSADAPADDQTVKGEEQKSEQAHNTADGSEDGTDQEYATRTEDDATRLPENVEDEQEEWEKVADAAMNKNKGAAPLAQRREDQQTPQSHVSGGGQLTDVSTATARNVSGEPVALVRDIDAGDHDTVRLDGRIPAERGPRSGQEGGAPLAEPTERKHAPGAPWPGPGQSLAASPTPSPEPGPEPAVQYESPQPIAFEHKPEAAVGLAGPDRDEMAERRQAEQERAAFGVDERAFGSSAEEQTGERKSRDRASAFVMAKEHRRAPQDGVERDESHQVAIGYLTEKALEGIGSVFGGIDDQPEPRRIQIALEQAARRVMSPAWWEIYEKHFKS